MEWRGREGGGKEYVTTSNCKIYYLENPIYYDSDNYELEQQADSNKDSQGVYVCVHTHTHTHTHTHIYFIKWESEKYELWEMIWK